MGMTCHHCGSERYRKNGRYQEVQRYICLECKRTYTSRGLRIDRAVKERALEMYLNNVGIRKTALFLKVSPASIIKWIRKAGEKLSARLAEASQ